MHPLQRKRERTYPSAGERGPCAIRKGPEDHDGRGRRCDRAGATTRVTFLLFHRDARLVEKLRSRGIAPRDAWERAALVSHI